MDAVGLPYSFCRGIVSKLSLLPYTSALDMNYLIKNNHFEPKTQASTTVWGRGGSGCEIGPTESVTSMSYNPSAVLPSFSMAATLKRRSSIWSELPEEIRVCTNRTCRRQGSMHILETLLEVAPADVRVKSCGCLGRCGSGPNLVALPKGLISHCSGPSHAARLMLQLCASSQAPHIAVDALALRQRALSLTHDSDFPQAHLILSQAIDLNPFGGLHILYKDRSAVRLAMGDPFGALEDARQALSLAPSYAEAYLFLGDAYSSMDQYDLAEKSYSTCLEIDPSYRRSKSFKVRIASLQEKMAGSNIG